MTESIKELRQALKDVRESRTRLVIRAGEAELKVIKRDREIQRLKRVITDAAVEAEEGEMPWLAKWLLANLDE